MILNGVFARQILKSSLEGPKSGRQTRSGIALHDAACHDRFVAVFWIVLAVVLGAAEVVTGTFVLLMVAVGAAAAAIPAAVGAPGWAQALIFALVSIACLGGVRPIVRRHLRQRADEQPLGLQAIEGSIGLVLEAVDNDHGLVKIEGELWSARPYDATQTFETGERVRVIEVRGATALVWKE